MEILRRLGIGLLGMIDGVVYYLIELIYGLLMDIARATPFDNDIFSTFADRVYALLGIFMLFKVSFSLIKYIVNPDEFNDKIKGGKKLVTNILIVLVLIVTTPIAFDAMQVVQKTLLNENMMEKLILGTGVGGEAVDHSDMGRRVKMAVFTSFYRPDDAVCGAADPANRDQFIAKCEGFLGKEGAALYADSYENGSVSDMIHKEIKGTGEPLFMRKKTSEDGYVINYMIIVSTVAGIFTTWIFLVFCVDIAIRTVKLGFLQLISPIPIISYIDPSSAKNGMFSKWIKEVGKTYIDLFIRLGAIYFAITLIAALMENPDLGTDNFFARVFIILGILIFANQIPKLLGDLIGAKIDGNFSLNPMRKITSSPLANAVVGGAAGLVGGGVANAAAKFMSAERNEKGEVVNKGATFGQMLKSGIGGALMGSGRAAIAGTAGKTSPFKNVGSAIEKNSRIRNYNEKYGGTVKGMMNRTADKLTTMAGIKYSSGSTNKIKSDIQIKQHELSNVQLQEKALEEARLNLINQQGAATGGLLNTFDYKADKHDEKGRVVSYEKKIYEDYMLEQAQAIATANGKNWAHMDKVQREMEAMYLVNEGKIATKETFNQINEIYMAKGSKDIEEAKIQKEITELQEASDLRKNVRPGGKQ